jgi:hypothetical protein
VGECHGAHGSDDTATGRKDAMGTDGGRLLHVVWKPGTRDLMGACWCGRIRDSPDPIRLWAWMDEHDHAAPETTVPIDEGGER